MNWLARLCAGASDLLGGAATWLMHRSCLICSASSYAAISTRQQRGGPRVDRRPHQRQFFTAKLEDVRGAFEAVPWSPPRQCGAPGRTGSW